MYTVQIIAGVITRIIITDIMPFHIICLKSVHCMQLWLVIQTLNGPACFKMMVKSWTLLTAPLYISISYTNTSITYTVYVMVNKKNSEDYSFFTKFSGNYVINCDSYDSSWKCEKIISRLKSQVQDILDSDAVLESMSEAEKQVTLAKAQLVKNIPSITASLKLLLEIMIWITVSFTALWTMQKIALRREFNRQLG